MKVIFVSLILLFVSLSAESGELDSTYIELWDETTEGGDATLFYEGADTIKLYVRFANETNQQHFTYFYSKNNLDSAFAKIIYYNRPAYWSEKIAKEMGDSVVFDWKKSKINEYFVRIENRKFLKFEEKSNNIEIELPVLKNDTLENLILSIEKETKKQFTHKSPNE